MYRLGVHQRMANYRLHHHKILQRKFSFLLLILLQMHTYVRNNMSFTIFYFFSPRYFLFYFFSCYRPPFHGFVKFFVSLQVGNVEEMNSFYIMPNQVFILVSSFCEHTSYIGYQLMNKASPPRVLLCLGYTLFFIVHLFNSVEIRF